MAKTDSYKHPIINKEGLVDIEIANIVLNDIANDLMDNDWEMAAEVISQYLHDFGDYARRTALVNNTYSLLFLEVFSNYCYNYAICLYNLEQYEDAIKMIEIAGVINVSITQDFLSECEKVFIHSCFNSMTIPEFTIQELVERKPRNFEVCRNELLTYLKSGALP
jgi:tetratricopeptide (TPR) repeat protein